MNNKKKKRTLKQNLALAGIVLLVLMYLANLVLALIGSEFTRDLLKGTMIMTIAVPIILYGMLVVMQGAERFRKKPEDELLTDEEKEGYYRMREAKEEADYQERLRRQESRRNKSKK